MPGRGCARFMRRMRALERVLRSVPSKRVASGRGFRNSAFPGRSKGPTLAPPGGICAARRRYSEDIPPSLIFHRECVAAVLREAKQHSKKLQRIIAPRELARQGCYAGRCNCSMILSPRNCSVILLPRHYDQGQCDVERERTTKETGSHAGPRRPTARRPSTAPYPHLVQSRKANAGSSNAS